ncbi:MAG: hypothetical protein WCP60_01975 [bacterium]
MILLISLLLAQSSPTPAPVAMDVTPAEHHHTRHALVSATPSPTPEVRITLVNATSVSAIALNTRGTNRPFAYPYFPQGTWTGNDPIKTNSVDYLALTTNGALLARHTQKFPTVSSQILLLTGDLSTSGPADSLPQIGLPPPPSLKPWPPNLQFHTYSCSKSTNASPENKDICRYRVVNGMPSKLLILRAFADGNKPGRQLALLAPGNSALFIKQPPNLRWEAEIDGQIYPVVMEQEDDQRNCLIPFFLRNGVPSFIRVFENP